MGPPKSRTVVILVSLFVLIVLSFFILRTALNLMNQRSDLSLILGITGVAIIMLLWGLFITKLVKITGCKKCSITEVEASKEGEN